MRFKKSTILLNLIFFLVMRLATDLRPFPDLIVALIVFVEARLIILDTMLTVLTVFTSLTIRILITARYHDLSHARRSIGMLINKWLREGRTIPILFLVFISLWHPLLNDFQVFKP